MVDRIDQQVVQIMVDKRSYYELYHRLIKKNENYPGREVNLPAKIEDNRALILLCGVRKADLEEKRAKLPIKERRTKSNMVSEPTGNSGGYH